MKRLTSLSFAFLMLFQSAGFGMSDIIQMGDLIEHASYHSENYGDNFADFLAKHYGNLKENHGKYRPNEKKEHDELPFQHDSCQHSVVLGVILPYFALAQKVEIPSKMAPNFYYQNLYSSTIAKSIFQPPKHA